MPIPSFNEVGDLPAGVYCATLRETLERFGRSSSQRRLMGLRLERIYQQALSVGHLARFIVFGSFVTTKTEPNDVDVFMLMEDSFAVDTLTGESRLLFEHADAQAHFGASVFWMRRLAVLGGEDQAIGHWQIKRDGGQRGIIEIVLEAP